MHTITTDDDYKCSELIEIGYYLMKDHQCIMNQIAHYRNNGSTFYADNLEKYLQFLKTNSANTIQPLGQEIMRKLDFENNSDGDNINNIIVSVNSVIRNLNYQLHGFNEIIKNYHDTDWLEKLPTLMKPA